MLPAHVCECHGVATAQRLELKLAAANLSTQELRRDDGALRNLHATLAAADAEQADMTSMTWYVVDYTDDVLTELFLGSGDREAETGKPPMPTALTLVGVSALWKAGLLVEISATAVI